MRTNISLILLTGLVSNVAYASTASLSYSSLVHLVVDASYQGQEVVSVKAHVGAHSKSASGLGAQERWADAHDVLLTAKAGVGFVGTATLEDSVTYGSPGNPVVYGPKVSYQLTLKSGEVHWASDVSIPILNSFCIYPQMPATSNDVSNLVSIQKFIAQGSNAVRSEAILVSSSTQGTACIGSFLSH